MKTPDEWYAFYCDYNMTVGGAPKNGSFMPFNKLTEEIQNEAYLAGYQAARDEAAKHASTFSTKPDRTLHTTTKWDDLPETVKLTAHSVCQLITIGINHLEPPKAGER